MNPASDIGKRNLPSNIRNRFTEIFVDELDNEHDLTLLIKSYLDTLNDVNNDMIKSVVEFYLSLKKSSDPNSILKKLTNGVGMPPTYSLRTLCRGLKYASNNFCNNTLLSVYDGICLSFLTDLNRESSVLLEEHIKNSILKKATGKFIPAKIQRVRPKTDIIYDNKAITYINIEDYWILKGLNECVNDESYIFTKSAKDNLKRIARVCSARLPCLVQGDTSIGKTSLIKWLAKATGNTLIRINNHDHTDLQEYIGSYIVDPITSKLVFKEGLLVQAMRHGFWILLDELNLASSEVLEALNRVLDDNRELYIPETQEVIRAHPRFLLFATQNPPGKYAGRKQLSRAFRNRFIELHFDELPDDELLTIVEQKCKLPKTYATLLIRTISELKTKRSQVSGIFLGKNSLITLRDLFRWARRYTLAQQLDESLANSDAYLDWKQYLAEQGFLLLCARCRAHEDVLTIHGCIEKVFAKKIEINNLYNPETFCTPIMALLERIGNYARQHFPEFIWTPTAKRLALLTALAYSFNEPFLLVGETGLGKTTICQILAMLNSKRLHIINCHMHSEAADFLGSIRPVRDTDPHHSSSSNTQLFEWKDGPLVEALKNGDDFLIDEISLADDSVLERLNSVLEEEKTLLLAENVAGDAHSLKANEKFRIFSTMNPSGDFGKKELSAALRNRFTEIWCPNLTAVNCVEFRIITEKSLLPGYPNESVKAICVEVLCDFLAWLSQQTFFKRCNFAISIRDLTAWIKFVNRTTDLMECVDNNVILKPLLALIHGACLIFIDSLSTDNVEELNDPTKNSRAICMDYLFEKIQSLLLQVDSSLALNIRDVFCLNLNTLQNNDQEFKCGPFSIQKGEFVKRVTEKSVTQSSEKDSYCFESKTTLSNLQRIMRCLMMNAPIMLEGSPGVGKTSLVEALGRITKNKVVRINLSEQTDLNELFGADLPCEATTTVDKSGNQGTKFQQRFDWHDGPFLMALKKGKKFK
jgi:midasin